MNAPCQLCGRTAKLNQVILGKTCPPALLCRTCRNDLDRQERQYGPKIMTEVIA